MELDIELSPEFNCGIYFQYRTQKRKLPYWPVYRVALKERAYRICWSGGIGRRAGFKIR